MSYQGWILPTALREDLPGGPALRHVAVPAPGSEPGGAQLLPLAASDAAYQSLISGGINSPHDGSGDAQRPVMVKSVTSGAQAVTEYLPADGSGGRLQGLILNALQDEELVLGEEQLQQLRKWVATLRMEALLASELEEGTDAHGPASDELARLLAQGVPLFFVRTPDRQDIARDGSGHNIMLLTSLDAAALCAHAYGKEQLRAVTPQELLGMAARVEGEFGYVLTMGPDRRPYQADAATRHAPMWHTRAVTAEWLTAALRQGGVQPE